MPGTSRYHAPPVSFPVGRCFWEAWVLSGLCLLLLGVVVAAAAQGADPREHAAAARFLVLGLVGWVLVVAWAGRRWQHSPRGRLLWREGQWQWWPEGQTEVVPVAAVHVALDGQGVLLLRLAGGHGQPDWMWLERRRDVAHWDDLRRAVWAARPMGYISRPPQPP